MLTVIIYVSFTLGYIWKQTKLVAKFLIVYLKIEQCLHMQEAHVVAEAAAATAVIVAQSYLSI